MCINLTSWLSIFDLKGDICNATQKKKVVANTITTTVLLERLVNYKSATAGTKLTCIVKKISQLKRRPLPIPNPSSCELRYR